MIARIFLLVLGLLPMATTGEAGIWDKIKGMLWSTHTPAPTIDVLVVHDQPSAMLELRGKYHIYDPNTKQHISSRFIGKKKNIQTLRSGLKWGEEFPGIYQLHIVPDHQGIVAVVDGVEYRGSLFIYDIGGTISIVNRADIEDYLSSILPQQFQEPMSAETSAAVAIASRTNAFYRSQNKVNKYWAVDAQQEGYKGLSYANTPNEMDRAVKATSHMVMSNTGAYEGSVTPFAAQWSTGNNARSQNGGPVFSRISLYEAEELGNRGQHAAQILSKAFPGTHIELIY